MAASAPARDEVVQLAARHNIEIDAASIRFNDAGLDFRVVYATAADGRALVLRIPRRSGMAESIDVEARILDFVAPLLTVEVPRWIVRTPELIVYPLLPGHPALTLGSETGEPMWHVNPNDPAYAHSFVRVAAELHAIDPLAAERGGIPSASMAQLREEWDADLALVSSEFTIAPQLLETWQRWLGDDSLWPEQTRFTHGELYAAHVLVDEQHEVRAVLDWTTARVADPAVDFVGHYMVATPEGFADAVDAYARLAEHVPERLSERCAALASASPLRYARFALDTGSAEHRNTAAVQLNPSQK